MPGPSVTISDVIQHGGAAHLLRGFEIEAPKPGAREDGYWLHLAGHLVLRESPGSGIALHAVGGPEWNFAFNERRPELVRQYPDCRWAFWSCFDSLLGTVLLPRHFQIDVYARRKDTDLGPFATIYGSRTQLPADPAPRFEPIMLTTMGRTGATWLSHLLGQHPTVAQADPFRDEGRVACYWLEALAALAEPNSALQTVAATDFTRGWWLGGARAAPPERGSTVEEWLSADHVEQLLSVLKERVDAFYDERARVESKAGAGRFVEKCWPESSCQATLWEIYPHAREIFLVRDFRDMLASMRSYGDKRGRPLFGQTGSEQTEEFVAGLGRSARSLLEAWKRRSDAAYLLRYEDLVTHPPETLTGLLEYLGLQSDRLSVEQMLEDAQREMLDRQAQHRTTTSVGESVGRWRRDLDNSLVRACQDEFADALEAFGYS